MSKDRRSAVFASTTVNGVDYARLGLGATTIQVFFINQHVSLAGVVTGATLTGGSVVASVPVKPIAPEDWTSGPPIALTLYLAPPGDPSTYTLRLTSAAPEPGRPALDPYFAETEVSFLAGTDTAVDCEAPPPTAPAAPPKGPPIDYLAKDFASFRNALLGFSALRYPAWQERSEADFGVMFLEALCSLADDFSYHQDRIAAEAHLDTATERRSLVRLARLVDYEPQPALSATVTLQLTVATSTTGIPAGLAVMAGGADGTTIAFETGQGLADVTTYPASPAWNAMTPYVWDAALPILAQGATELWVLDPGSAIASSLKPGLSLLIESKPEDPSLPDFSQIVQITAADSEIDPLDGTQLAHIAWEAADALTQACALADTTVRGNLVPATQGLRHVESFAIGSGRPGVPLAIARRGPNGTTQYLYPLGQAELSWFPSAADPEVPYLPEIQMFTNVASAANSPVSPGAEQAPWTWMRWLLNAEPFDAAFTVDPMRYVPVAVEIPGGAVNRDYDGSGGWTLRFGDGSFGQVPPAGSELRVVYRAGGGAAGNVAAGAVTTIDPNSPLAALASSVTNPFPARGGADAQTPESVRQLAPQAYKTSNLTATVPADFAAAAKTLDWVDRAGSVSRYTGAWLTTFTTPDPRAAEVVTPSQLHELDALLDRRRIAGRESVVLSPSYVALDLQVVVGARADAFRSTVRASVADVLSAGASGNGVTGFFAEGNFTFGEPLERSALEAAIQGAQGVAGVVDLQYRKAGSGGPYSPLPAHLSVGASGIIQVDNDPRRPLAGSVAITVQGGK